MVNLVQQLRSAAQDHRLISSLNLGDIADEIERLRKPLIEADALIDKVVEFCLTHTEHYSVTKEADAVKINQGDHYWMTVRPNRTKPNELLPSSAEYRRKRIEAWKIFARAALASWKKP